MANILYGHDAAAFGIGFGPNVALTGGGTGDTVAIPDSPGTLQVFDVFTGGTAITALRNATDTADITVVTPDASTGRIAFRHVNGDGRTLFLDSGTGDRYPIQPADVGTRVRDETASVKNHTDWSDTNPTDGQLPTWNNSLGQYVPTTGVPASTIDWANVTNKPTIPDSADDIGAIPTSEKGAANGVAQLDAGVKVPLVQLPTGTGATQVAVGNHAHSFPVSALPSGVVMFADGTNTPRPTSRSDIMVLWTAPAQPVNALNNVDVWLNLP